MERIRKLVKKKRGGYEEVFEIILNEDEKKQKEIVKNLITLERKIKKSLYIRHLFIRFEKLENGEKYKEEFKYPFVNYVVIDTSVLSEKEAARYFFYALRRLHQLGYTDTENTKKACVWLYEQNHPVIISDPNDYKQVLRHSLQETEVDAVAYMQMNMAKYYEEDVVCEDEIVQYRIDAYKKITFNS